LIVSPQSFELRGVSDALTLGADLDQVPRRPDRAADEQPGGDRDEPRPHGAASGAGASCFPVTVL
jgi:hypothetical protein